MRVESTQIKACLSGVVAAVALGIALLAGIVAAPGNAYAAEPAGAGFVAGGINAQANGPFKEDSCIYLEQYDSLGNDLSSESINVFVSYDGSVTTNSGKGISYNQATNTITLKGCNNPYGKLYVYGMGDDLKLVVVGANSLASIVVADYSETYDSILGQYVRIHQGASLTITGTGTLDLNKAKALEGSPLTLSSGYYAPSVDGSKITDTGADPIKLTVESTVNFNVYTDGSSGCAIVNGTSLSFKDTFVFKGAVSSYSDHYTYVWKAEITDGSGNTTALPKVKAYQYMIKATELHCTASPAVVGGSTYKLTSAQTAILTKAANKKTVTIPKTVTVNGQKFAVAGIAKNAFAKAKKCKTVKIKTKKLTKKSVKKAFAKSKVKTVKVPKAMKKAYKTYFTKGNCGKSVSVK